MPPSLLAADRQDTWTPVWYFTGSAWPDAYATRDIDVPGPVVPGDPFTVGDSEVGGDDLVGGGAGATVRQGYFRIINVPTITRTMANVAAFGTSVEVSNVTVELANADGALSGDYQGATFTLTAYDPLSAFLLEEGQFICSASRRNRGTYTIEGTSVDPGIPEDPIPKGVIDAATYPLAVDLGKTPTWLFGNATNLPLLYVRDDEQGQFDYFVCRETAAAIVRLQRVTPNGADPFVSFGTAPDYTDGYIELEPYPGMSGVLKNGNLESWTAGPTADPDHWTRGGAGATIAKNQTVGQVDEGATSCSLTRVGTDCYVVQDLVANTPFLPLSWWRGRTITVTARLDATVANRGALLVNDLVAAVNSTFHSGSGLFETRSVTFTVNAAATSVLVGLTILGGNTTVHLDDVRVYLKAKNWEEVLRTDLYLGYTAIRCYERQTDASGALLQLVGDINGLQAERNPVRAARTMLSDTTHGLGRIVDAATFDQAERDVARYYADWKILHNPQVLLTFDRFGGLAITGGGLPTPSFLLSDASGHGHIATVTNAGALANAAGISSQTTDFAMSVVNDASGVDIPYSPTFDPTVLGWTGEIWYKPAAVTTGITRPIMEKLVGLAAFSGLSLYEFNDTVIAEVVASGGIAAVALPRPASDNNTYLYCCARARDGILTLTIGRSGVLTVGTTTYAGTLPSGDGVVRIGRFGTGGGLSAGRGTFDNAAVYNYALDDAVVAATAIHGPSIGGSDTLVRGFYDTVQDIITNVDPVPVYYYRMAEKTGTVMTNSSPLGPGANGVYVGAPTLAVQGPLSPLMPAPFSLDTAVSFTNNPAQYGKVAGMGWTSGLKGGLLAFYTPDALEANSAIGEKTVGGAVNTSFLLFQEGNLIRFRVKPTTTAYTSADYLLTAADVGRPACWLGTYDTGDLKLFRNGVLVATASYVSPIAVGTGDFLVGALGGLIYPCQGDVGQVILWDGYAPSGNGVISVQTGLDDAAELARAATWYPGGLLVDVAMTEARQAQDWLKQVCQLRGIRFGFTATGAITCSVDAVAPATILMEARDGAGDGERTLLDCRDRQRPALNDAVRDLVVNYRRDLLSGAYLGQLVRRVGTRVDAQGVRIGSDRIVNLDAVREDPSADRFACYMAALLLLDETVSVTLGPEARALAEAMLIRLTDAAMGYAADLVRVREVTKSRDEVTAVCAEYDEDLLYTYRPNALMVGAGPE